MVLNDEQVNRFFDTMDALLYYVNDKFRVVKGFSLESETMIDDVKASMVARELWDNVEVIDDFVRENPFRLPEDCLEVARRWKCALPGFYTLVRYQSGKALLMNDAGVFSVMGVTLEIEGEIGPAPAGVELVLLPFDDVIVYDGFLQAYDLDGVGSKDESRRIQDEFERRCASGIVSTASEFMQCAEAYLSAQRDLEFEKLLADMSSESARGGEEELPAGFHRGVLANLPEPEREAAVRKHLEGSFRSMRDYLANYDKRRVHKRAPVTGLGDCLALMTKAELQSVADSLYMGGLSRLRKAEMIEELSAELPHSPEVLHRLLVEFSGGYYETARRAFEDGRIEFDRDERENRLDVWPLEPYTFMFRNGRTYTVVVPDELRPLFASLDFEEIDRERRRWRQALACANACAVLHGVSSVDDAYDQYRALCSDSLSAEGFRDVLAAESTFGGEGAFDLWNYGTTDYLVHYTLGVDYLVREFTMPRDSSSDGVFRETETGALAYPSFTGQEWRGRGDLISEMGQLENYKRNLVEMRAQIPMKPLPRIILEQDVMACLFDDRNVIALRNFLDGHVPDGQNDYVFADRACEEIVFSSIEVGSLEDLFDFCAKLGLDGCCSDAQRLPQLVTNVFNAMPSWENNGWSPQELYEQMTGRRLFYNEDGSIKRVGADDPCPCGSGKKYRECCGAL